MGGGEEGMGGLTGKTGEAQGLFTYAEMSSLVFL